MRLSNPKFQSGLKSVFWLLNISLIQTFLPIECGLGFTIDWSKNFVGKEALLRRRESNSSNRLITILLDDLNAVPIGNAPVLNNGMIIGKTISAAFGHRVDKPVVIADVGCEISSQHGREVEINIAGVLLSGRASTKAAFDPEGVRMRMS